MAAALTAGGDFFRSPVRAGGSCRRRSGYACSCRHSRLPLPRVGLSLTCCHWVPSAIPFLWRGRRHPRLVLLRRLLSSSRAFCMRSKLLLQPLLVGMHGAVCSGAATPGACAGVLAADTCAGTEAVISAPKGLAFRLGVTSLARIQLGGVVLLGLPWAISYIRPVPKG